MLSRSKKGDFMDTIVRNNGIVNIIPTVVKTIKYLIDTKPGFYSITDIQNTINSQVEPKEQLTTKMIRSAIVQIIGKSHK